MEQPTQLNHMLDLMTQPGFCVRDGRILQVNPAARGLLIEPGTEVRALIATGEQEYAAFSGGCLYLGLDIGGRIWGACVTRTPQGDVFLLDDAPDHKELNALALAAQSLRGPLSQVMAAAGSIGDDQAESTQLGRLNKGLSQVLRLVNNMSDALLYTTLFQPELVNITAVFEEIFEKARHLLAQSGLTVQYAGPDEDIPCAADVQQLERAILNMLSNAARFTPCGGTITARLSQRGKLLQLTVEDSGEGIPQEILGQVFHRYLRQPTLEDGRYGLGLGLALVRTAALNHGGTVLIDRPGGTRITLTLTPDRSGSGNLRSPIFRVDYASGRDHALMELSQVLPSELYEKN